MATMARRGGLSRALTSSASSNRRTGCWQAGAAQQRVSA